MTSTDYTLPALPLGGGDTTILRWLKRPGEQIAAGEPLLIVLTTRAEIVLPAPAAGVLARAAEEGSTQPAGAAVAAFAGEAAPATTTPAEPPAPSAARATPLAHRIAAAHGIELEGLAGSGPGGRITKADVLAITAPVAAAVRPAAPMPAQPAALPIAQFTTHNDTSVLTAMHADLSNAAALCEQLAPIYARRGLTLDLLACVAHAAATALLRFPLLNGWWHAEGIVVPRRVQLAYQFGARTGTISDAQDRNLQGIARALAQPTTSTPPTFFVCSGAGASWRAPQARSPGAAHIAALMVNTPQLQPVALPNAERLSTSLIGLLTLSYDARLASQAYADAFLGTVAAQLARVL